MSEATAASSKTTRLRRYVAATKTGNKDKAIQAIENIGCTICGSEHVRVNCVTFSCFCADCDGYYDPSAGTYHLQRVGS